MHFRLLLLLIFLPALAVPAPAQVSGRNPEKEKRILEQLQTVAPNAVEDFKNGTSALDSGNIDEAIKRYESVTKQAPQFDHGQRRLGLSLAAAGRTEEGLVLLESAVQMNRSPENLGGLAQVIAYPDKKAEITPYQMGRAFEFAKEANSKVTDDDPYYPVLLAQLSLDTNHLTEFRQATEKLAVKNPDLMQTHLFNAILAAMDEHWMKAETEIKLAESMGFPHEDAQRFLDSGVHTRATVWRYLIYALLLVAVWVVGLLLLFVIGKLMSQKTLRSIESGSTGLHPSDSELSMRKWYRSLINIAGFYYYISLPVVIFLVVMVAATITYVFLVVGWIPVKLLAILCLGALLTIYKMIRSLFVKIQQEDPGRSLGVEEAPGLWDLARKVAQSVGTRPVDEIRLTPGTDLSVYEKGSFRERSNDKAKRILVVGAGVINDFDQNGFRAVLAHEYGHFSHRDTAGGDIAIRVNADMIKFAYAMAQSGQAVPWNIAFQFLRVFHFLFRRISHGATRLQEVLADRVAASKFGPKAFEEGLTHVVRKSVEFKFLATKEIEESLTADRALQNLYELPSIQNQDLENEIEQALKRTTSEDDTHPSPVDRFRFTSGIVIADELPVSGKVWDLFANRAAVTAEMTKLIQHQL
jgi:Zn-dependent protease with chaperone function